jgi:hypothetical protein
MFEGPPGSEEDAPLTSEKRELRVGVEFEGGVEEAHPPEKKISLLGGHPVGEGKRVGQRKINGGMPGEEAEKNPGVIL